MVWNVCHMNCKLDLITVRGNLNGQSYRQNIIETSTVPHFDNHPLNTRSVFMDDNARPHRARVVTDYLRDESITTLPWPARSPDLKPNRAHLGHYRSPSARQNTSGSNFE